MAPKSRASTVADETICRSVNTKPNAWKSSCRSDGEGSTVARPRRNQNRPSYENGPYPLR